MTDDLLNGTSPLPHQANCPLDFSLRLDDTTGHSDAIKGGRKNQIPIAALLFGDKRGEGLVDRLGEVTDQFT